MAKFIKTIVDTNGDIVFPRTRANAVTMSDGITGLESKINEKVDSIVGKTLSTNDYTDIEKTKLAGIDAGAEANSVDTVAGRTGDIVLAKADVGLDNVDNTSDVNKPISIEQAMALGLKVDKVTGKSLVDDSEISRLLTLTNYDDTQIQTDLDLVEQSLGNYLSVITHDTTLTGDGTASNPLIVASDGHTHDGRYYTETEIDTMIGDIETILDDILGGA